MRNISFLELVIETVTKWPIVGVVAVLLIAFLIWWIKQFIWEIRWFLRK